MYRTDDADNILCSTEDCREHAALITTGLDYGLDPCRNFSTFVCSAWKQRPSPLPQQVIEVAPSAHADVLARWLMGFKSMLNAGTSRIPVGDRAEAMYDACLSRNGSQVTSLRSFMTELNLSWPDRPSPSVSPLRVLVNMAYNWHTPLWFDVRLVSTRSVRVVVLSPGDYVLPALRRHKRLVASGKYGEYWRAFYESFSTARYRNDEAYPATNASSVQPRPSAEMQGFVLTVLFNATTRGSILRSRFKIEQFDEMTKKDHASEWLSALEESLKPSQSFTSADEVFASGIDVVAATDAIFSRYARADVLELIGWSFADKYGPLADDKLLSERFGEQNSLNARLALCAVEVEKAYQPLVTGLSIVSQFSPETRKAIYEELQSVVDAARNMVADARWMDDNTKALLRLKFENASFNLRTPLVTRIREAFSGAYNAFPSNWSSFLDTWKAVLQLSAQLNRRPGGAPSVLAGSRLPYFDYDYVTNEVLVTAAALSKPFYYTKGTESMFYAGLGFFFVKELVRSIDDTGITVDLMENTGLSNKTDSGNASDPWLSAEAVARSRKRSACLQPTHASTFPEIPALQVAYAAFTRARASLNNRERKLRVAIRFTEDQMFFLTVCHLMCAQHGDEGPLLGDCNKAVSNFPAFADAFSCPKDAPMSASRDCVYF
ncbi:neprilysin-1-like [Amblyomma americanum]